MPFHLVDHPLVQHKLGILRDVETSTYKFRAIAREITNLLTYEATRDMELEPHHIQGWASPVDVQRLSGKKVAVAPILRAGMGMLQGVLDLIPSARVNVVGLYRDEATAEPVEYYAKFCGDIDQRVTIVLDPMVATGGSLASAIDLLKKAGCGRVKTICLVAAPEGLRVLDERHPDVHVWGAALDERLDERKFIRPGLGDAGDRLFGTR